MDNHLQVGKLHWYGTSHPGQLTELSLVGAMSTSKSWRVTGNICSELALHRVPVSWFLAKDYRKGDQHCSTGQWLKIDIWCYTSLFKKSNISKRVNILQTTL